MVFTPFRSENGFRLFSCWFGIGYGFPQGTTGVYKYQLLFQFQMNKIMLEIQNGFQEIFFLVSNLSNDRHYFAYARSKNWSEK